MARTPNYRFERNERDRIKAAKKAEKLAAKAEKNAADSTEDQVADSDEPEQGV